MKKKNMMIAAAVALTIGGAVVVKQQIDKLIADDKLVVGPANGDFPIIENGEHTLKDAGVTAGKYAIYATEGLGTVTINGTVYELDSKDTKEMMEQNVPDFAMYSMIYGANPRVDLQSEDVLIVEGSENFKISFVQH